MTQDWTITTADMMSSVPCPWTGPCPLGRCWDAMPERFSCWCCSGSEFFSDAAEGCSVCSYIFPRQTRGLQKSLSSIMETPLLTHNTDPHRYPPLFAWQRQTMQQDTPLFIKVQLGKRQMWGFTRSWTNHHLTTNTSINSVSTEFKTTITRITAQKSKQNQQAEQQKM